MAKKVPSQKKCARAACECQVGPPAEYCSDYCSGAEKEAQPLLKCSCGHGSCKSE